MKITRIKWPDNHPILKGLELNLKKDDMDKELEEMLKAHFETLSEYYNKIGFVSPERRYEAPTVGTLGMCIV